MEDVKTSPASSPARTDAPAQLPASPVAKADAKPEQPIAKAPTIEQKVPEIYETLRPHLVEANAEDAAVKHPRVTQHAEICGFKDVAERDAKSGLVSMAPAWQVRALLARFKAHGLEHHSRISPEHFEKALHEALHGRI